MNLNSKQRAYLKSLAMTEDAIIQIGKTGLTPEIAEGIDQALAARELVKINVQKNAPEESLRDLAETIADRTRSVVVQVIGRKIVMYRPGKDRKKKIELPR